MGLNLFLGPGMGTGFWHVVDVCGRLFVQEYGEVSTGIYVSEDFKNLKLPISDKDIDPPSRHFHYMAFDEERNVLIATLGDRNIVGVTISSDCRHS
jgi:hypothetical protein